MFCPKCGKINPDNDEACSGCGAALHEKPAVKAPEKKGRGLKIVFAIIAVLIIVCIIVFLLNGCGAATLPEERMTF